MNELCSDINEDKKSKIREKWLYVILSWLWNNRINFEDPLSEVENIYADFDYPVQIESFIKYIPPTDGYDPSLYSYMKNIDRLMKSWESYLQKFDAIFK